MEIRIARAIWYNGAFGRIRDNNERIGILEFHEPTPGSTTHTFEMTDQEAQVVMDDLWAAGYRPTEGAGSAGALKATEYHLEDMRKLVFMRIK